MSKKIELLLVFRFVRRLCWLLGKIFCGFRSIDSHHVPAKGPCILAANHASYIDPPLVAAGMMHRPVHFLARDTLYSNAFARWLFPRILCVPLDRSKGDIAALRKAITVLKSGDVIGLFPEGTRTTDGELQEPKGGIGFLIAKAGVPVVPVYVKGTFDVFPKGAKFMKPFHKISTRYGKPIMPAEWESFGKSREAYEKIGTTVMARIAAMKDEENDAS